MADPTTSSRGLTRQDVVTLKEHLEDKLKAQQEFLCVKLAAQQKASELALEKLDGRIDAFCDLQMAVSAKRDSEIADLKKSRDEATGKASQSQVFVAWILSGIGIVMALVDLLSQ